MSVKTFTVILGLLFISTLTACQTTAPATASPTPIAVATSTTAPSTPAPPVATCADVDANWSNNWPAVLEALEHLIAADQSCGEEPLLSKKYAAHFSYGASLEEQGQTDAAVEQYQAALFIDSQRQEALNALIGLQALPKPTPAACLSSEPPRPDPAPAATPDTAQFVTVQGDQLQLNGEPFKVKGVNYYPRRAPWQRFLTEANPAKMAEELDLIKQAGFNTLRIFLWYEPLFTCQPEDAIPNEAAFAIVDKLLQLAAERDLRLIVTLNDLPDLTFRPLYTDYDHYDNQTVYIVRRYRNEPSILAWDLRNEGDIDYGAQSTDIANLFEQDEVVDWVAHVSQLVRDNDPHHLVTAGWWGDPTPTAPYVDFLSFHHWADSNPLQVQINEYRRSSDKPLLLGEIGYHSWTDSPVEPQDEQGQADTLGRALRLAEAQNIGGWIVWTAFDFVPAPGQAVNQEHFFGLWRTDLTSKPILEALPLP